MLSISQLPTLVAFFLAKSRKRPKVNRLHMPYAEQVKALGKFLGRDLKEPQVLPLTVAEMHALLSTEDLELEAALFDYANSVTESVFGPRVSFRGIIEFSNICVKDCGYCGIRKHRQVSRYAMKKDEMVEGALWAFDHGYGSLMLQSGELPTESRQAFMVDTIKEIKRATKEKELKNGVPPEKVRGMGVAIGLGELSRQEYQELFDAGAHRYLLRIETSNPDLYARLHPSNHSWENRRRCLQDLKEIGYQVGTGIMIALPGQTFTDLANDLKFFRDIEADMIGCGPYIVQEDTPVGKAWLEKHPKEGFKELAYHNELLDLTCRFLALARITLGDVNISATTALQAINPVGREIALGRGANQLMPILTTTTYRQNYQLYAGKPCIDEGHEDCRSCLTKRVEFAGKKLHLNDWADPPSWFRRRGLTPWTASIPPTPVKIAADAIETTSM